MITLTWWQFVVALAAAAAAGSIGVALLFALVADTEDAPPAADDDWGDW